jgi:acyl-CoA dehydrogenase
LTMIAHLDWPFFCDTHRALAADVASWTESPRAPAPAGDTADAVARRSRALVAALGAAGFTAYCVRAADGGRLPDLDARSVCLLREMLAHWDALADFALAMQGLGSAAITLAGSDAQRRTYLPGVAAGTLIAAFALSEPDAGSDVAAMRSTAQRDGGTFVLNGTKAWISNGGIADFYCVFARTTTARQRGDGSVAADGISAFVVEPGDAGLEAGPPIELVATHPLAELRLTDCRIPAARMIGGEGEGFKIAMRTLDVFRTSVAAAALGLGQRAFDEALRHARDRRLFGRTLGDFQLTQAALADMATGLEAARLLTYRAAWFRDSGKPVTLAAAMAKLSATETAQRVVDRAVQMFGGRGVVRGEVVERLYREIRALRIYEGASEVQKLIIARELLRS